MKSPCYLGRGEVWMSPEAKRHLTAAEGTLKLPQDLRQSLPSPALKVYYATRCRDGQL